MQKFRASEIVEYAKSLADIQNSNYITWGDSFRMLNSAYRKVYQDIINFGDTSYLSEISLIGSSRVAVFELPSDFYQLAIVTDKWGREIGKRGLADTYSMSYELKNNTISLYNCRDVILKYYPTPEVITYKRERSGSLRFTIVNGAFGSKVIADNKVVDLSDATYSKTATHINSTTLFGQDSYVTTTNGVSYLYYYGYDGTISTMAKPMLTTSGSLIANPSDTRGIYGFSSDDASYRYMWDDAGNLYYNDTLIGSFTDNKSACRCVYWNGRWVLVTTKRIIYEDGSWETTDSPDAVALLKCSTDTGYGYLVKTSPNNYSIEGWAPDTIIDFPNHTLFDLVAYNLAIQYRMKQNSDSSALQAAYNNMERTYYGSISDDGANYVTIRNVDRHYGRFSGVY